MDRIKGSTRTRTGDNGFTELVQGERIPKSDYLCFIYSEIQEAIVLTTIWNLKYNLLEDQDLHLLKKLINPELNNLGASLWSKITLRDFCPSNETYKEYENRRLEINSNFKSARDFIVFSTIPSCELYLINIKFRKIEHYIWYVIHKYYGYLSEYHSEELTNTGSFYNMLGDYFFNLCRYVQQKLNEKEDYWNIQNN
jgi:cob(I)alamin adenosyltransferase